MTDYTPTTEQVRITFVERTRSGALGTSRADQEAAFDRWLAEVKQEADRG